MVYIQLMPTANECCGYIFTDISKIMMINTHCISPHCVVLVENCTCLSEHLEIKRGHIGKHMRKKDSIEMQKLIIFKLHHQTVLYHTLVGQLLIHEWKHLGFLGWQQTDDRNMGTVPVS